MSWGRIALIACSVVLGAFTLLLGFVWWVILGGEE